MRLWNLLDDRYSSCHPTFSDLKIAACSSPPHSRTGSWRLWWGTNPKLWNLPSTRMTCRISVPFNSTWKLSSIWRKAIHIFIENFCSFCRINEWGLLFYWIHLFWESKPNVKLFFHFEFNFIKASINKSDQLCDAFCLIFFS